MLDDTLHQTALNSVTAKVYASKLGYFNDEYSRLFSHSEKKMMPIINRGTWTRVFSVRTLINNFIEKFKDEEEIQILTLGAGFDTTFFYFEDNNELFQQSKICYFEADFQEISQKKISTIKENSCLERLIFQDEAPCYSSEDTLISCKYRIISCNIQEIELLKEKLNQAGIKQIVPTLVLMECVLCSMDYFDGCKVLSFISSYFEGSIATVSFDMIRPFDLFGQIMISNLEERGCFLPSIKDIPDEDAQISRMLDCGFK